VEDLGRPGFAHVGVTTSGAADRGAYRLANRLLANPDGAAALEITLGGFSALVCGGAVDIAVLNAAIALIVAERAGDLRDGAQQAAQALDNRAALDKLEALIRHSNRDA